MRVFLKSGLEFFMALQTRIVAIHVFGELVIGVALVHGVTRQARERAAREAR